MGAARSQPDEPDVKHLHPESVARETKPLCNASVASWAVGLGVRFRRRATTRFRSQSEGSCKPGRLPTTAKLASYITSLGGYLSTPFSPQVLFLSFFALSFCLPSTVGCITSSLSEYTTPFVHPCQALVACIHVKFNSPFG